MVSGVFYLTVPPGAGANARFLFCAHWLFSSFVRVFIFACTVSVSTIQVL